VHWHSLENEQGDWYTDWQSKRIPAWTLSICGDKKEAFNFKIGLGSDPHLWPWILNIDWKNIISGASSRDGSFGWSTRCDTSRQCTAVIFIKPWMQSHFSGSRYLSYVSLAMCPECPTTIGEAFSSWPHPRESGPEVVQGPSEVTTSPTLLGPVLLWSEQNYLSSNVLTIFIVFRRYAQVKIRSTTKQRRYLKKTQVTIVSLHLYWNRVRTVLTKSSNTTKDNIQIIAICNVSTAT